MAFRGQYEHSLDSKGRITIPAKRRAQLADGVVLLKGLDACIDLYPVDAYERFTDRFLSGINPLGQEGRLLHRRFNTQAEETELDSAGRVRVPDHLAAHAGLGGQCMIVGVGDHFEIWDAEAWRSHEQEIDARAVEIAEGMAGGAGPAGGTSAGGR